MMMAYHRDYQKYQAKTPESPYLRSKTEKKPRLVRTAWQSRAKKTMTTIQFTKNNEESLC